MLPHTTAASVPRTVSIRTPRSAGSKPPWSRSTLLLIRLAFFFLCLALYQVLVTSVARLSATLPTVQGLVAAAVETVPDPKFWAALGYTVLATAMGLAPCALGSGDADVAARAFGLDWAHESSVGEFLVGSRADGEPAAGRFRDVVDATRT